MASSWMSESLRFDGFDGAGRGAGRHTRGRSRVASSWMSVNDRDRFFSTVGYDPADPDGGMDGGMDELDGFFDCIDGGLSSDSSSDSLSGLVFE